MVRRTRDPRLGQALVEFALVFPIFMLLLFGIIVWGFGVFYQQQVTNAARDAARYASIHSATAQCPTVSTLDPAQNTPEKYARADAPPDWLGCPPNAPGMTATARNATWGVDRTKVYVAGCWSGFVPRVSPGWTPGPGWTPAPGAYDAPPPGTYTIGTSSVNYDTVQAPCSIGGVWDPQNHSSAIACGPGLTTSDTASDQSDRTGVAVANSVTVYACYTWAPPMAGFLFIPSQVTQIAVVTEPIERQQ